MEYAIEAIKLDSTAIGIQTSDGVILAVEKRITSSLMEPSSIEKVHYLGLYVVRYVQLHLICNLETSVF